MPKQLIVILMMVLMVFPAVSQNKTITYSELLKSIYSSTDESLRFKNIVFKNDIQGNITDRQQFEDYVSKLGKRNSDGLFVVNKVIEFESCTFEADLLFYKTEFTKRFYFHVNTFPNRSPYSFIPELENRAFLRLFNCSFNEELIINSTNSSVPLLVVEIIDSDVKNFDSYLEEAHVDIGSSTFTGFFNLIVNKNDELSISNCAFILEYIDRNRNQIKIGTGLRTNISDCRFTGAKGIVLFVTSLSNKTILTNDDFNMDVQLTAKNTALMLRDIAFKGNLGLDVANIEESEFIDPQSLKSLNFGMYVSDSKDFFEEKKWSFFDGSKATDVENQQRFKYYMLVYKRLYDYFRLVGDINAANTCYVKIRELDGQAIQMRFESEATFKNFFNVNLNRLLKYYTVYGTEPARAIVISVYVVVFFGIFYFFFPSDWDSTSKKILIQRFKDFIEKNEKGYFKPFLQLLAGFSISLLNAITLSLNAFTTLGFGNIPTHGVARYVCVLQGFIGWFLLSIFTVALINQAQF